MSSHSNHISGFLAAILSIAVHAVVIFAIGGFDRCLSPSVPEDDPPSVNASRQSSGQDESPGRNVSVNAADEQPEINFPMRAPNVHSDNSSDKSDFKIYVVRPGDNLTRIAEKDKSTFEELAKLNDTTVKKLSRLRVGQKIKLKNGVE